ncbi:phosphate ABC transporter permease subunit PstC [Lentilactobacillus hilgardii]|uniref:Phosphate transport system permease protein n=1 Tax=Lentilactobacillus hilgardii (strain ATCC 8290 / DSM 20176 / CCUG 30140 / JCM 1155 / KCTC 3500 / NBRC 15886 / NCIMB 8040 / NRRL B-1843 / 9) TaxID=1423757 RepID=C0XMR4_LENH9|nr:phosphate ABC transporter permease subunit PstC [Lentilactobacillus hilgardii]EEI23343.1 phosphate ABC transporter, permease protein PstC [Lentilactobacillus hilgardii DSM 20176 = ATCC 8290]KRK54397.1 phosphate ABC superfamily ATP binding cassette transporter, permease protein [Lentilactobacillus hilgardii DSM 20176 = ATCC 8290]MCP9333368.1 phosphate ABC transporter permease subunit PstC [Lentilactobacillus hilgardii]MCP9349960.1 phosphate ABC transporter permease subunit PstC [Lentilactobac
MQDQKLAKQLFKKSKTARYEHFGRFLCFCALLLIMVIVIGIILFIATKGMSTFLKDHISMKDFFTGTLWNPGTKTPDGHAAVGALPMILGSFLVTILAAVISTPFAIGTAVYMTEISPKRGAKILQPVTELLVGIPSVVYGFIGLSVVVPFVRNVFGGSGFGILSGTFVLFVMILPTIVSMTVDSLKSVPTYYRQASLALGATKWQTIWKVVLRAATPGILTAVVFGMARAFGEALAVQMVIGNASLMPHNLISPASTLTSVLTAGMGNTVMGSMQNDALWSLALVLLVMSLLFNLLVHFIGRKGAFSK